MNSVHDGVTITQERGSLARMPRVTGAWRAVIPAALVLAGCASTTGRSPASDPVQVTAAPTAVGAPMVAGTVYIWRGVNVLPNSTHIDWSAASFGVSPASNPTLSFFNAQGNDRPCWLRVPVAAPVVPVPVNGGGDITLTITPAVPPDPAPGPSPWAATYDDASTGHWAIARATITPGPNVSSAAAARNAARVFKASTAAGQVTIHDGLVQGCQF